MFVYIWTLRPRRILLPMSLGTALFYQSRSRARYMCSVSVTVNTPRPIPIPIPISMASVPIFATDIGILLGLRIWVEQWKHTILGRVARVLLCPVDSNSQWNDRWSVRTTHPPSVFFSCDLYQLPRHYLTEVTTRNSLLEKNNWLYLAVFRHVILI